MCKLFPSLILCLLSWVHDRSTCIRWVCYMYMYMYMYMYIYMYICRLSAIYVSSILLSLYIFSFIAVWISLVYIYSILFVSRFIPFTCRWHMVTLDSECSQNCCCVCVGHDVLKVFSTCIYKETLPAYDITQLYSLYNTCSSLFRQSCISK